MTLHCPEEPVVLHFHFVAMRAQSAAFLSRNVDQWRVIEPEFVHRRLRDRKASIVSLCFHVLLLAADRTLALFHSLFLLSTNPHVHTYTHQRSPLVNRSFWPTHTHIRVAHTPFATTEYYSSVFVLNGAVVYDYLCMCILVTAGCEGQEFQGGAPLLLIHSNNCSC